MSNQLATLVGYSASASLGLPESYGALCLLTSGLLLCIAVYFLHEGAGMDITHISAEYDETCDPVA